jgi:hypothetical protein
MKSRRRGWLTGRIDRMRAIEEEPVWEEFSEEISEEYDGTIYIHESRR